MKKRIQVAMYIMLSLGVCVAKANNSTYVVEHPDGIGTVLLPEPSFSAESITNRICEPENGAMVSVLEKDDKGPLPMWYLVNVQSGECEGKTGWIAKDILRLAGQ